MARVLVAVGSLSGGAGLAACTPATALAVTTTAPGADVAPGDGVCEVTASTGDCSLRAAIEEANALGAAEITVPTGAYTETLPTITGDIGINRGMTSSSIEVRSRMTVAVGGVLWIEGVWAPAISGGMTVDGVLVANRLTYMTIGPTVLVSATGKAVLQNAVLASAIHNEGTITNNGGEVVIRNSDLSTSALRNLPSALETNAGTSTLISTVIDGPMPGCTGLAPSSGGYNVAHDLTCGLTATGDAQNTDPMRVFTVAPNGMNLPVLQPGSPLLDRVPVGTNGCGDPSLATDVVGAVRPVDGDGVGGPACDTGAAEAPADA